METPGFIFSTTGQGAPTYEELQKQRTVLAHLLAQKRGPPKNIGEGLTALGEGFGDLMYGLQTRGAEKAAAAYSAKEGNVGTAPPVGTPSYTPETPPAAAPAPAAAPGPQAEVTVDQGAVGGDTPVTATAAPVVTENTGAISPDDVNVVPDVSDAEMNAARASERAASLVDPATGSTAGVPTPRPAGTANAGPTAPVVPTAPPPAPPVDRPPAAASVEAVVPGPQSAAPAPRPGVQLASATVTPDAAAGGPLDFIAARGGHASVLKDGVPVPVPPSQAGSYAPVNNEFAARLAAAGKDFEAETGKKAKYGEMSRGNDVQAYYYDRYQQGTGGIAARPGRSRHQHGEATDLPTSEFRDWLYANKDKYGLHFPVFEKTGTDKPHVQMNPRYAGPAFSSGETQVAAGPQRDRIAATLTGSTPMTTADRAQEERIADVTGSGARGPSSFSYPPTAARGDVTSDIAPSGVSALTGGNTNLNVGDTAQARRDSIAKTLTPPPITPPPGAPTAQKASATISDAPPVGVPQPPIAQAPPVQPIVKPSEPKLMQPDTAYLQRMQRIASDPRLDPVIRKQALDASDDYQKRVQHHNDQLMAQHQVYVKNYLEETSPSKVYATEKARRDLEGEGFLPIDPDRVKALYPQGGGPPPGQAVYQNRRGELKLGPMPAASTNVTIDQKGETEFAKENAKTLAKTFGAMTDESITAQDDLALLGEMRKLGVQTGPQAALQGLAAKYGIKIGDNVGAVEAYQALVDRMVPRQRLPGSGNTSDFDAGMFKSSLPALMKTEKGNQYIQDTMEMLANNKLARGDVSFRVQTGEITPQEGVKQIRELQKQAKARSDEIKDVVKQFNPDEPATAPGEPVKVQSPADAMKLEPGTRFITPDGRIKVR